MKVCGAGVKYMKESNITVTVLQQAQSKEMRIFVVGIGYTPISKQRWQWRLPQPFLLEIQEIISICLSNLSN